MRNAQLRWIFGAALVTAVSTLALPTKDARACGCFAPPPPPMPTVPTQVVQAGEKLVFSVENGIVTMHVQIRYSGNAADFGWLLPLPAIPKDSKGQDGIELGSEELFDQLETRTQPTFTLSQVPCPSAQRRGSGLDFSCGCGLADIFNTTGGAGAEKQILPANPLVRQDSVGPFSYAILKADNKTEMVNWLNTNRYLIADGSDAALAPYIRPGAYFLAVKLLAGKSAGDLQPLVIRYQADMPMIPVTLTQIASTPQLGILVWVLGQSRAFPRNYFHTVINEAQLDWQNQVKNYAAVAANAVAESPGKHSFITEFAGTTERMQRVLDSPGRFDMLNTLSSEKNPMLFVNALLPALVADTRAGFVPTNVGIVTKGLSLNGQFVSVIGSAIPMPAALVNEGVKPADYYSRITFYLGNDRFARPEVYRDIEAKLSAFDPVALVSEIKTRIVAPTLAAGALMKNHGSMTRLYTMLAPADMNLDPVFSFNPDLPYYSNDHRATINSCDENVDEPILEGRTSDGSEPWKVRVLLGRQQADGSLTPLPEPYSQRIEVLRDVGQPELQTDNRKVIADAHTATLDGSQGCTARPGRMGSSSPLLALSAATLCALLLRRRRRWAR